MKKSHRFFVTALLLGAYLLSACTGAAPKQDDSSQGTSSTQSHEVVFTGTVQSMGGAQWLISGEQVQVDGSTAVDANIQAGDIVKVEAVVSPDGTILALKVESAGPDDTADDNGNSANDNAANSNDDNANANDNTNTANDNANSNSNANSNGDLDDGQEISGVVEAITDSTITVGGVTYNLTDITEFKDLISLGDLVKIHVIITADGILVVREIETTPGTGIGDDNSNDDNSNQNGNDNGNGDNSNDNDDDNSNGGDDDNNSNGDDDNSNSNSNDND